MNFQRVPRWAQRGHIGGRWWPPAITAQAPSEHNKVTTQVLAPRKCGLSADAGSMGQAQALLSVAKTPRTQAAANPHGDHESKGLPYTGVLPGRMTTTS